MIRLTTSEHLGAAAATFAAGLVLCVAARRHGGRWVPLVSRGLAVLLVANLVYWEVATALDHQLRWTNGLLLDVCPVSAVVAVVALWSPRPLLVELTFLWGCTSALVGLVSPDAYYHFPDPMYFQFYVTHSGVFIAGLFLVVGRGFLLRPSAVPIVLAVTLGVVAVAGVADLATGGDYAFLRDKRATGTLGDLLGPWPWYILGGALLWALSMLALATLFGRKRVPPVPGSATALRDVVPV